MIRFFCDINKDKRLDFAKEYLENYGYEYINEINKANFILLGINDKKYSDYLAYNVPVFAGNINDEKIYNYTKYEPFTLVNAYLTAEGTIQEIKANSNKSIINSKILIIGSGRISKALQKLLSSFTNDITVCARNNNEKIIFGMNGYKVISFDELKKESDYDYIINTVPHPVLNQLELNAISNNTLIIDVASFPGGVDLQYAKAKGINVVVASGLPAKYSPKTAGYVLGKSVIDMIEKEGII